MRDYWPSDWPAEAVGGVPMVVPAPSLDGVCEQVGPSGRRDCTRPIGHAGRHAAGGMPRSNGLCPVYEVWEDDA